MTAYRTHQITPTLIGDGPWGEGLTALGLQSETGSGPPIPAAAGPHPAARAHARCALRPQPCAVKAARDFAHATLSQWDVNALFDDAAVVISELVTNAVRYGQRAGQDRSAPDARVELVLLNRASCIVCVVTDPNPGPPVRLDPDFAAETGRGLCVVESLSKQWGWTPLAPDRKAVWAALALPAP
jgi:anti-sigma regulatory factor (Ser/Thr protein kinase)